MSRPIRRGTDAVAVVAVAALVALAVVGPSSPAPAGVPVDTFAHVDVVVGDGGVRVEPAEVPAGQLEVTVRDTRAEPVAGLAVHATPGDLAFEPGTQLVTARVLRTYELTAFDGSEPAGLAPGSLTVSVPQLAAPREATDTVTVEVHDGMISAPKRDSRYEQPLMPAADAEPPSVDRAWTAVAPGETTLRVHNGTESELSCSVEGHDESLRPRAGTTATLRVRLAAAGHEDTHHYVLTCAGSGAESARQFGLWMA